MRDLILSVTKRDLRIEMMRGSGKGGQNRNTRDTAVRITHTDSGAVGYAEDERSQAQNRKLAFRRMTETETFKTWLRTEVARRSVDEARIQRKVDDWLRPKFVRMETMEAGRWVENGGRPSRQRTEIDRKQKR